MKQKNKKLILLLTTILTLNSCIYSSFKLIDIGKINKPHIIEYYNSDNELFYSSYKGYECEYLPLDKINPWLIKCLIISEDKTFYKHQGINIKRIVKSLITNLKNAKIKEGASTISQQVSRLIFLNNEKKLTRKIKEAFIAFYLEANYSKEKILEIYINSLYFGLDIYGAAFASKFYFNEKLEDLSLAKCAYLASIINSPNVYLKEEDNYSSLKRKDLILRLLKENKIITLDEYKAALDEKLEINKSLSSVNENHKFYINQVDNLIKKKKINLANKLNGLKVYTNYDEKLNNLVNANLKNYQGALKNLECSLLIIDVENYSLLVNIGSKNYSNSSLNRALSSLRQIGSLIKPLIYYLALINNYDVTLKILSKKTDFNVEGYGTYSPSNYNNKYPNREITMLEAIATSDNIYACKLGLHLGSKNLKTALEKFTSNKIDAVPSLFLGTNEMTLEEISKMYLTFASLGYFSNLNYLRKIENNEGEIIYKNKIKTKRLLIKDYCLILNQALLSTYDKNINKDNKPTMINYAPSSLYACKSGSTSLDNYVIGYNQKYLISIWVGDDKGDNPSSSNLAKVFFKNISNYLKGDNWYKLSNNILPKKIDPLTGDLDSNGSVYYFIKK